MKRLSVVLAAFVVFGLSAPISIRAQTSRLCFPNVPGITNCIEGRFRQYWEQNGGLAIFGYPITGPADELNRDTNQTYLTQSFERNRFELHPENAAPYDVLLGRLGDDRLRQLGRDWNTFPKAQEAAAHYFPESGHAIENMVFWTYWSTHGLEFDGRRGTSRAESLALFGLPISEPAMERNAAGDTVLTQWFERARFEYHPNNPEPSKVLLGLLGNEVRGAAAPPSSPADVRAYLDRAVMPVQVYSDWLRRALEQSTQLTQRPQLIVDAEWKRETAAVIAGLNAAAQALGRLDPVPSPVARLDALLKQIAQETLVMTDEFARGVADVDLALLGSAGRRMVTIGEWINQVVAELARLQP